MHRCRRQHCNRKTKHHYCSVSCWLADVIDRRTDMPLERAFSLERPVNWDAQSDLVAWAKESEEARKAAEEVLTARREAVGAIGANSRRRIVWGAA